MENPQNAKKKMEIWTPIILWQLGNFICQGRSFDMIESSRTATEWTLQWDCFRQKRGRKQRWNVTKCIYWSTVLKYNLEVFVLYLSIFILYYIILLHIKHIISLTQQYIYKPLRSTMTYCFLYINVSVMNYPMIWYQYNTNSGQFTHDKYLTKTVQRCY